MSEMTPTADICIAGISILEGGSIAQSRGRSASVLIASLESSGWRGPPVCPTPSQIVLRSLFGCVGLVGALPLEGLGKLRKNLARSDSTTLSSSSSSLHFGILSRHGRNAGIVLTPGGRQGHLLLAELGRNAGPAGFHLPQAGFQGDDAHVVVEAGRGIVRPRNLHVHVARSGVRIAGQVPGRDHAGDAGGAEEAAEAAAVGGVVRGEGGNVDHGVSIEMVVAAASSAVCAGMPPVPAGGWSLLCTAASFVLCKMGHVKVVIRRIDLDERHRCGRRERLLQLIVRMEPSEQPRKTVKAQL
mmetsp:Transcript_3647/g.10383  ORF Transcript_3647/g.10383 Transcript_3647/m.10383 type:complete len:300 (-) Transcript_3647:214-1113(-)